MNELEFASRLYSRVQDVKQIAQRLDKLEKRLQQHIDSELAPNNDPKRIETGLRYLHLELSAALDLIDDSSFVYTFVKNAYDEVCELRELMK